MRFFGWGERRKNHKYKGSSSSPCLEDSPEELKIRDLTKKDIHIRVSACRTWYMDVPWILLLPVQYTSVADAAVLVVICRAREKSEPYYTRARTPSICRATLCREPIVELWKQLRIMLVVLALPHRHNLGRGHKAGSYHSGAEEESEREKKLL